MFDLDVGKMLLFGAITLVVVGPKDLPRVLRAAGQVMARARRIQFDLKRVMTDFAAEADLDSINKEFATVGNQMRVNIARNPATAMRGSLPSSSPAIAVRGDAADEALLYASPEMQAYLATPPETPPVSHEVDVGAPPAKSLET